MVCTLRFISSKCSLFHNSNTFGSCIIHILYIYSTNIGTEYFKHGIYSLFFSLSSKCSLFHNSNVFGFCIIQILYTGCAKIKKNNNFGGKMLINGLLMFHNSNVFGFCIIHILYTGCAKIKIKIIISAAKC